MDDYRKKSYLDVHASWVDRDFRLHHAALAVRHFDTATHTGENTLAVINDILMEYNLPHPLPRPSRWMIYKIMMLTVTCRWELALGWSGLTSLF